MTILFLTGAGISANAGIATYRDEGSSWTDSDLEKKSHATRYGNHLDELWDKHWGPLQQAMLNAEPTYTHKAIAEFQKTHDAIVVTQNIDDLHERAGSDNILHVHGEMQAKCMKCGSTGIDYWNGNGAPGCLICGSTRTRPNVVLFGEMLNLKKFNPVHSFAVNQATHIIAVGTSLNVFPAATLVMDTVGKDDKTTIIINKQKTGFSKYATYSYETDCDTVIDEVLRSVSNEVN